MSLDGITESETIGHSIAIPELEIFLEPVTSSRNVICAGVDVTAISNSLFQQLDVVRGHTFWVSQNFGHPLWYRNLIDSEVGVWGDNSSSGEVYTFS